MRKGLLILILFFGLLFAISFQTNEGVRAHTNGAPSLECDDCHSGAEDKTVEVIVEGLPSEYQSGKVYTVKLKIKSDNESFGDVQGGFAVKASAGSFILLDKVNTQISDEYVTHTNEGNKLREWVFGWKAPTKKVESVEISIMAVAANGDYSPNGDAIGVETLRLKPGK